ncbi:hypothetical protein BH09MYX1_BH09MYX1_02240 [soil metagenome]
MPIFVASIAGEVLFPGSVLVRVLSPASVPPSLAVGSLVAVFCLRELDPTAAPYRSRSDALHDIGCSARVRAIVGGDEVTVVLEGQLRVRIDTITRETPGLAARISIVPEGDDDDGAETEDAETRLRGAMIREIALGIVRLMPELPAEALDVISTVEGAGALADVMAANVDVELAEKVALLANHHPKRRLQQVLPGLVRQLEVLEMRASVTETVNAELAASVRESDRASTLAMQRRALVAELDQLGNGPPPAPRRGLGGLLRRVTGTASLAQRLDDELATLRAGNRLAVRRLQIDAIDAELAVIRRTTP